MSLESGGRADKYGNEYENRYLARLLLRLVNEDITSVIVEPLGADGDGVEFVTTNTNGLKTYYQCKSSNTTHNSWSISDLKHYKVFERSKAIVERAENNCYFFISPLQYDGLDELCKRARTNSSPQDFVAYQLSNASLRSMFNDCASYYDLSKNEPLELNRLINILAHCYFEQSPSGLEAEQDLNEHVGMFFTGKAASVRVQLEQYANNAGRYGVKITAKDVIDYLEALDIHPRTYCHDDRALKRIAVLNDTYWGVYQPIYNHLVHRLATDSVIQQIQAGHSVVLHGKAGSGKSGCVQETIEYLKNAHILYLSIKLDKNAPDTSADEYGKSLGLPESPVHCINTLSAGEPCVLILDQLDSLRWTSKHSAKALDVCKEMISQAEAINKYENGKLSIMFVSRTFDLENDKGLQALFANNSDKQALSWERVNVGLFSKEETSQIVGQDYSGLSLRLRNLLQTPSSLFVWSQLDVQAKANNISSVYQLMDAWWKQVQDHCELAGISRIEVQQCKDTIVSKMDENAVFALPVQLFIDHQKVIDVLVSNGLVIKSAKSLSFTHQSFLDYFIAAGTLLEIYSGKKLADIIGHKENQTPNLRYRLLTVLQNLLDSDRSIFIKQSKSILSSEAVRYYFKCTAFEVMGQCDDPDDSVYNLVQLYLSKSEWKDYIIQTIYYGHPAFIIHMNENSEQSWIENRNLILLRSISCKVPDFVVDILRPYSLKTIDDDQKVFGALCHDAIDDSDSMFQLRMELLEHSPNLFNNFWGFSSLIEHLSIRAGMLFKIILEKSMLQEFNHVYLGEDKKLDIYAHMNYKYIVSELFPKICEVTIIFLPTWPHYNFNDKYCDWVAHDYDESVVRKIVKLIKISFEEFAKSDSLAAMSFINGLDYPISVVGHEIIMHAIKSFPTEYCDDVIRWLLHDFKCKVFVYTVNEADYLLYAKQIIGKYSPMCTEILFQQLEQAICTWKDDSEKMVSIYKNRIEVNKKRQWSPVYYAYWGHFQKELLPQMEYSRLSTHSRELLGVLNRNSWVQSSFYHSRILGGPAKSVVSPIDSYTERISDKCWLRIISTPSEKMKNRWQGDNNGPYYIEATHELFSSALAKQAKLQPARFAKLSLVFPDGCYCGYISSVIYAMTDCDCVNNRTDIPLMSNVIRQYGRNPERNIASGIAWLIEKRAQEPWPEDIIDILEDLALRHPDPKSDEYVITSSTDPENTSPQSLLNNSINSVRGCALNAISTLLWSHRELSERFRSTVIQASSDVNAAVRFAVLSCVLPYYNFDPAFSTEIFKKLLLADLRTLAVPGSWQILSRDYRNSADFYRDRLITACQSDIEELSECAAGLICAVAIFFEDQELLHQLTTEEYTSKQEEKICTQAAAAFNQDTYHELSAKILLRFIDISSSELNGINRLFFDRCIVIQRDEDFLIHLMRSRQSVYLVHEFLDYLNDSGEDITKFANVLDTIGKNIASAPAEWNNRLVVSDLIQCVIRLFDRNKDDLRIRNICLNIWDNLFKSNLQDVKPLSDMIDNFE